MVIFTILTLLAFIIIGTLAIQLFFQEGILTMSAFLALCLVSVLVFKPTAKLTGGFYPQYSVGERIGFITKASTKGILFRTNEIDVQMGSGQQASLQPHFEASVPNQQLFEELQPNIGRECKIQYRQWLIMPMWMGDTDYEVMSVEFVKQ